MKIVMNENRVKVVDVLKKATEPMTLKEIGDKAGITVASGSTNALVNAGVIKKVGMKKVPVVTYREVAVYEIGDLTVLEKTDENEKEKEDK